MSVPFEKSITRITKSTLLRNATWFFAGNGVRLLLQAAYFVVIARALGVAQYGAFIGSVALMALVAPFSSWGTGFLLIKNVVHDRTRFARYYGAALCLTTLIGVSLVVLVTAASVLIWGNSLAVRVLLLVGISDVILVRILELAAQAFTAIELLRRNSELYIVLSVARTIAALSFALMVPTRTAAAWALLYLLSALLASIYSVVVIIRTFELPRLTVRLSHSEVREGFYFSVAQVSQTIYNDIDKAMLVRFSGLGATGIYGAAYRIVDASFAPVSAVVHAAFPRFFRHGESGVSGGLRFAKLLIASSATYGLVATVVLYLGAPAVPLVLGKGFASAALALRWLSPLVLIRSIHYFLADALTGAGLQALRTVIQLLVVIINVVLNLWLIPAYSWSGAAWASIATDGTLALAMLGGIVLAQRQTRANELKILESGVAM
jgi:O-antigen/teichoic acid export membrane protein